MFQVPTGVTIIICDMAWWWQRRNFGIDLGQFVGWWLLVGGGDWQLDWLGSIAWTVESGRSWRRMSPLDWVGPTTGEWTVRLFWLAVIERVWLSSFWIFNSNFVERDVCLLGKSVEELIALNFYKIDSISNF